MTALSSALKRRATAWAGQLTSLARGFAPAHVRPAIHTTVEERGESTFILRITADRKIAPDARAQEHGSGLHAKRGVKRKYPIRPKTQKVLAFHWDVADANPERFSFLPDGRVMFGSVQHPGIEAANQGKGYIAPAVRELKKRGKERLTQEVRQAVLDDIRRGFGKK